MVKIRIALLAVSLITVSLAGCDNNINQPSEEIAKNAYEQKYAISQCGTIESFKKTNGANTAVMGMPMYEFYYAADIKFNKACFTPLSEGHIYTKFLVGVSDGGFGFPPDANYRAGDKLHMNGVLYFQKTEKGWVN
jgi:hypothetical protein